MGKEIWIINGERMELDVLEVYTPTEKDRKEVEYYRRKAKHKKKRI